MNTEYFTNKLKEIVPQDTAAFTAIFNLLEEAYNAGYSDGYWEGGCEAINDIYEHGI